MGALVRGVQIEFHARVLIARRAPFPGTTMTGTAIACYLAPSGDPVYSIVLDAPTPDGYAMLECYEARLVVLPTISNSRLGA